MAILRCVAQCMIIRRWLDPRYHAPHQGSTLHTTISSTHQYLFTLRSANRTETSQRKLYSPRAVPMGDYWLDPSGPLNRQEIRLLELHPSAVANHDIECSLFRIKLNATRLHPYEALSYVWGDKTKRADIVCNEQSVSVTLSLFTALKRLRLRKKSRFIWADAICIDQDSNVEKSSQLPLMANIYSSAKRVVVWLGNCDLAKSEEALESVKILFNQIREPRVRTRANYTRLEEYRSLQMLSEYTNTSTKDFLKHLYDRPWFSRVWCIQEVILARDTVMVWGELELSWTDVGEIATWLYYSTPIRALEYEDTAFYEGLESHNAFKMYAIRKKRVGLLETLDDCRSFQATDLRDKVYGILALVEPSKAVEALTIDYNKDFVEVYADVVITEIRSRSNLDALGYVDHGDEYISKDNFTSWTPQWHSNNVGLRRLPHDYSDMSACEEMMVELKDARHLNSQYLRLKGCFYDKISSVHVKMDLENMGDEEAHPFRYIVVVVLYRQLVGKDRLQAIQVMNRLARTLTAGCDSNLEDIVSTTQEMSENFYKSFFDYVSCLLSRVSFKEFRKQRQPEESFYDEAEIVCTGRRFFQTENGSFGIGPACMRRGDVVVVLFGGAVPYVLRPCDKSYLYMGQAYIDDLMDGQLIQAMKAGTVEEREFLLV